jgi:hypothetical protein
MNVSIPVAQKENISMPNEKNVGVRIGGELLKALEQECKRIHTTKTHIIKQELMRRYGLTNGKASRR